MKTKSIILLIIFFCVIVSFTPKKISWVAIGDSITYLNDHADETGNRITNGYMTKVVEKLSNITYINQGHNGWTSGDIAESIDNLGLVPSDVYSIFLGTNDWWQGRAVGELLDYKNNTGNKTVYGSFRIIINKLRSLNKHARIILITPLQRVDFVYINDMQNNAWGSYRDKNGQSLAKFAEALKAIAKLEKFDVVDLYNAPDLKIESLVKYKRLKDPQTGSYKNYPYPEFIGIPFNPATDDYPYPSDAIDLTYDGLHPSDKGNQLIANKLIVILKKY